jgi:hypothetical protein
VPSCRGSIHRARSGDFCSLVNNKPPHPANIWMCGKQRTLSTCVFGSVASKRVTGSIFGSVANERLSGEWRVTPRLRSGQASGQMGKRWGEGGVPPSLYGKGPCNGIKRKEIEGVFRCKTTGLQRSLNGAMKGRGREESNARVLGSWSGTLGVRFFRVACNFICVGVASMARLHGQRYGGEYAGATVRKWSLRAGGRDLQERTENSKTARFKKKEARSASTGEEEKGVE